jgi:iodotyrosine deiodinase
MYEFDPLEFSEKSPEKMREDASAFYQSIKKRRTVREFSNRPVSVDIIRDAIKAAGTAPSGANMQPWYFVAISSREIKSQIRQAAEGEEREFYEHRASRQWLDALAPLGTDENKPFIEEAPYLIAVFLKKFSYDGEGKRLKNYYTSESVGIACGILLTALHIGGLVTLTHTPSPMKFLNKILNRDKDEKPYMLIVTGYPADDAKVPRISRKPYDEIAGFIED